jgi:uncharacterized phage protein (TIGR01671 family)
MSNEIKFRAWDKTYSLMNYKVQVGNTDYADQNYSCNSIWVDYGDKKSIGWMSADDKCIDLMQFTGLKDKNGVEIYEGGQLFVCAGYSSTVEFQDGMFVSVYKHPEDGETIPLLDAIGKDTVVIGNIYQNP